MLIDKITAFATEPLIIVGVSVLGILAVLNNARILYLRTRRRWPHAKFIWLLHFTGAAFLICSFLVSGMVAARFMRGAITPDGSSYWSSIWIAIGFGIVGLIALIVDVLAIVVERRRYGRP